MNRGMGKEAARGGTGRRRLIWGIKRINKLALKKRKEKERHSQSQNIEESTS